MNKITIGLSASNKWYHLFKRPDIFIEVPVARRICVSFYLIQVTKTGTVIRLADKFYKENKVLYSKSLAISHQKEKDIIDWGKTNNDNHTIQMFGMDVLKKIIGIKHSRLKRSFNTKNPYKIINLLIGIGKVKDKYSCANFWKR